MSAAEVMPGLYRAVLDAVGDLERGGRRREAAAIREEATKVYSRAWTPVAERRLRILQARCARVAAKGHRGRRSGVARESLSRQVDMERTRA